MRLLTIVVAVFAFSLSTLLAVSPLSIATAQTATPAADCPTSTEDENEATALRWHLEAVNEGNVEVINEITAPDIIHHGGTVPDSVGTDGVKRTIDILRTGFPDVQHTIDKVITEDDLVVILWTATGTQTGEFQGIPPTGKKAIWTGVSTYRFECGKIVEDWAEVDGLGRLKQLEVLGTPTP